MITAHLCVGLSFCIARCIARSYKVHALKWLNCRQCGTGADYRSAELSGHFGPVSMVPKCLGSYLSRVRSISYLPRYEFNAQPVQSCSFTFLFRNEYINTVGRYLRKAVCHIIHTYRLVKQNKLMNICFLQYRNYYTIGKIYP